MRSAFDGYLKQSDKAESSIATSFETPTAPHWRPFGFIDIKSTSGCHHQVNETAAQSLTK